MDTWHPEPILYEFLLSWTTAPLLNTTQQTYNRFSWLGVAARRFSGQERGFLDKNVVRESVYTTLAVL